MMSKPAPTEVIKWLKELLKYDIRMCSKNAREIRKKIGHGGSLLDFNELVGLQEAADYASWLLKSLNHFEKTGNDL